MTIFLDSADLSDIARAEELGLIRGITMNPRLMRAHTDDPLAHLSDVLGRTRTGIVMYQTTNAYGDAVGEALKAFELDPDRVVIKVPSTLTDIPVAAHLIAREIPVALTAIVTGAQMLAADAVGAKYVIPYVDRAARSDPPQARLVGELHALRGESILIVAASIKSAAQAIQSRLDGADYVSAPIGVISELIDHPVSSHASDDFGTCYTARTRP